MRTTAGSTATATANLTEADPCLFESVTDAGVHSTPASSFGKTGTVAIQDLKGHSMTVSAAPSGAIRHRGGTINGVLITLSIVGALTAASVFWAPQYLNAQVRPGLPEVTAAQPGRQSLIEDLAAVIEQSVGVLAIHPRGATPYEELVLWLADDDEHGRDGRADDPELAVLSHSSVLRTITIYRMAAGGPSGSTGPARSSPEFCRRWRADARVRSLVLGRDVADMRVETVGLRQEQWGQSGEWGVLQRLRLTLTWAPDSADGADEASVLVDTVLFPDGAGR